jgi:heme-degrading monooxygenase HmoA
VPPSDTLQGVYVIVWEFVARPDHEAEFERAYGPHGRWAGFFRGGEGYAGTELWRGKGRWVTVDRWENEAAYQRFRDAHRAEYEALDREMSALTIRENRVGAFTTV